MAIDTSSEKIDRRDKRKNMVEVVYPIWKTTCWVHDWRKHQTDHKNQLRHQRDNIGRKSISNGKSKTDHRKTDQK